MSLRVCAECNWVINNRHSNSYECPKCNSNNMCCPILDKRDWNKMYEKQKTIMSRSLWKGGYMNNNTGFAWDYRNQFFGLTYDKEIQGSSFLELLESNTYKHSDGVPYMIFINFWRFSFDFESQWLYEKIFKYKYGYLPE